MAYAKCNKCKTIIHLNVEDAQEFHEKHEIKKEPIYCFECFKEIFPKEEKNNK